MSASHTSVKFKYHKTKSPFCDTASFSFAATPDGSRRGVADDKQCELSERKSHRKHGMVTAMAVRMADDYGENTTDDDERRTDTDNDECPRKPN